MTQVTPGCGDIPAEGAPHHERRDIRGRTRRAVSPTPSPGRSGGRRRRLDPVRADPGRPGRAAHPADLPGGHPPVPAVVQELVRRDLRRRASGPARRTPRPTWSPWPTGPGRQGWRLRAKGSSHNWSPLSLAADGSDAANVVLVDTKTKLTAISVDTATSRVRVQTGATMLAMLTALENAGLGVTATPAPGDLTVGGVLAIDGHGTAVPKTGEVKPAGHTYGSISNLVQEITAVVWNAPTSSYVLKTYARNDVEAGALMAHVGRSFITEVVLQAGRQPAAALPELVRRPGDRAVRTRGLGRQDVHELPELGRPGRGDLVPVHVEAVAEGVERRAEQAAASRGRSTARTTTRSATTCRSRSSTCRHRSSPATPRTPRASATSTTTSSRPAWSRPSPTTSGAGRRTCCSTCGPRPCG